MRVHLRGGFTQPEHPRAGGSRCPAASAWARSSPPLSTLAPAPSGPSGPPWGPSQPHSPPTEQAAVEGRDPEEGRPDCIRGLRQGGPLHAGAQGQPLGTGRSAEGCRSTGHARLVLELELEEVVGYLGPALAGEDEHPVPAHGRGEVAAGGRDLAALGHLCGGEPLSPREGSRSTSA